VHRDSIEGRIAWPEATDEPDGYSLLHMVGCNLSKQKEPCSSGVEVWSLQWCAPWPPHHLYAMAAAVLPRSCSRCQEPKPAAAVQSLNSCTHVPTLTQQRAVDRPAWSWSVVIGMVSVVHPSVTQSLTAGIIHM
jgi:hypothetical protein